MRIYLEYPAKSVGKQFQIAIITGKLSKKQYFYNLTISFFPGARDFFNACCRILLVKHHLKGYRSCARRIEVDVIVDSYNLRSGLARVVDRAAQCLQEQT
jgi:hypothetical protein